MRWRFVDSKSCVGSCLRLGGGSAGEFDRDGGGDGGKSGGSGAESGPKIWRWGIHVRNEE